ncbi:helix-turn-helix domain-containing protein [Pelosinus sp. sgz500959]|uniref:helix-turn-helix domain-containing protein n=1 Tax=Pelosinus sp. sgz500959 TaxID=3242472 RepID=UPI00366F5D9E
MESAFYSVKEASVYLGVPVSQVYNLVRGKNFPMIKIGRHYRISKTGLTAWSTNFAG